MGIWGSAFLNSSRARLKPRRSEGQSMRSSTINRRIIHLKERFSAGGNTGAASVPFELTEEEEKRRLQALLDTGYVEKTIRGYGVAAATPPEDREWVGRLTLLLTKASQA